MSSDKEYIVRNMKLTEEDLRVEKKYPVTKETWIIKYALPDQQRRIARMTASEFGGLAIDSFLQADQQMIIRDIEVNELVEGPEHWDGVDSCLDEDLKNWLWEQIQKHKKDIQEKLKKNRFTKRISKGKVSS